MEPQDRQQVFSGTGEVKDGLGFDLARLEEFLAPRIAGFAESGRSGVASRPEVEWTSGRALY